MPRSPHPWRHRLVAILLCWLIGGPAARAVERLDRGVVAFPAAQGNVYVGWRLLAADSPGAGFDVYRRAHPTAAPTKLNRTPILDSTNFTDETAAGAGPLATLTYAVNVAGESSAASALAFVALDAAASIGGVRRIKLPGDYAAQKVAVADLDGDGRLDYVIKQPNVNSDPADMLGYWKPSLDTYKLEAYRHDGTFLWRHDLGHGIETGIWYSPFVVYDLDGDGCAEIYCKAGPAGDADPRDARGKVTTGPEFLVKLDGRTGRELARLPWPIRDDIPSRWPDLDTYPYYSRNLMGIAYLDGQHPHLIVERGTYTLIKVRAYDPQLKLKWNFESKGLYEAFSGQGTHGMQVADIDGDGRDEIVIGAAAIDDDGRGLWSTLRNHPDACYVADIDPAHPGLEVFYSHEYPLEHDGVCLVDARTGQTRWGFQGATVHVHSQGFVADIDPTRPGMECYAAEKSGSRYFLYDAQGTRIGDFSLGGLAPLPVWWTAEPTKAIFAREKIFTFQPPPPGTRLPNTGGPVRADRMPSAEIPDRAVARDLGKLDGTIIAIADVFGDWREEVIVSVPGELLIYSTTIPAHTRRTCLMQDRHYRTAVAMQTMGYLYAPIVGGQLVPEAKKTSP